MRTPLLLAAMATMFISACSKPDNSTSDTPPPFVKTVTVQSDSGAMLGLSGTVRARVESPLSFQVGGRIAQRLVDSGQLVRAGQVLFALDTRDLQQQVNASEADVAAAEASLATANADLTRSQQLFDRGLASEQALERAQLVLQEAQARRDASNARLAQARNAFEYGKLASPSDGVLIDVRGENGQVVAPGQAVAVLAQAGQREVELNFPEHEVPPQSGVVLLNDGSTIALTLREVAGSADSQTRTVRARYRITENAERLVLGSVVRTRFHAAEHETVEFSVPIAALDDRGHGPRVWRLDFQRVNPVAVDVIAISNDRARIRGPLTTDDRIVSLGTHLLIDDMLVRELAR